MEFSEVLSKRKSVRAYLPDKISESDLDKIIQAANSAPSAGNLQSFKVFIVQDKAKRELLSKAAYDQDFVSEAPVCMVFCADPERSASEYGKRGRELYSIQDATIAASFAVLKAVDLGLGTVWVGAFNEFQVKDIIGATSVRPVAIVLMGHAAENEEEREKKRKEEIFKYI